MEGLRCHRTLLSSVLPTDTAKLKGDDYSFVVAYDAFQDDDYDVEPKSSAMIDLSDGLDAAFAGFSATSRNEVRGSHRLSDLSLHTGFDEIGFDEQYSFHAACEHERNWIPVAPGELAESIVFAATHAGSLIAGVTAYRHGHRLRIARIYSSKRSQLSDVLTNRVYGCAQKRLIYEVCAYGASDGVRRLDLGGVDPDDPAKAGIARFKASFGPTIEPVFVGRYRSTELRAKAATIRGRGWDIA